MINQFNAVYLLHSDTYFDIMTENSDIIVSYANSDNAILEILGKQLKQMRLNKNYTQKQLSELSGLSRSAISDLENNGNGSMKSLVQILRALEKLEILNHFISKAEISPIQVAKLKGKIRKRASGTHVSNNNQEESQW